MIFFKKSIFAFILTLPCLGLIFLILNLEISPKEIVYDGSIKILWRNLALICTVPYLLVLFVELGRPFYPRDRGFVSSLYPVERWLVSVFTGAGLLTVIGTLLGLLGLLVPSLLILIICTASFSFFFHNYGLFTVQMKEGRWKKGWGLTSVIRILSLIVFLGLMSSQLWKLESDIFQMYRFYFEQARLSGTSVINPAVNDGFGFLVGRGHGVMLFFTSLTNVDGLGMVSYLYIFLIAMMVRQITVRLLSGIDEVGSPVPLSHLTGLVPDIMMLFTLWICSTFAPNGNVTVNPGRLHSETGGFMMYFIWIVFLISYIDSASRSAIFKVLLFPAIALPIMLPTSIFIIALTLGIGFVLSFILKDVSGAIRILALGFVSLFSTAISIYINQSYVGIGEVNPYQLFLPFSDKQTFTCWSSPEFLVYVNNSQGIAFTPSLNMDGLLMVARGFIERVLQISIEAVFPLFAGKIPPTFNIIIFAMIVWIVVSMMRTLKRISRRSFFAWSVLITYIVSTSLLCALTTHTSLHRLLGFQTAFGPILLILPIVFFNSLTDNFSRNHSHFIILFCITFCLYLFFPLFVAITLLVISLFKPVWRSFAAVFGLLFVQSFFDLQTNELQAVLLLCFGVVLYDLLTKRVLPPGHLHKYLNPKSVLLFWIILFSLFVPVFSNIHNPPNRIIYAGSFTNLKKLPWAYSEFKRLGNYTQSFQVFSGQKGYSHLAPFLNDIRCERFLEIVPRESSVLPLNGGATIIPFCAGSPLLKPGKIIETLHPPFAPDFRSVMLGTPEQAIEVYRKWNVNYFLIEKGELHYWASGVSDLFSEENLLKYFDTQYSDADIIIFTWRGKGKYPVKPEEAKEVETCRGHVNTSAPFAGLAALRIWDAEQRKGTIK